MCNNILPVAALLTCAILGSCSTVSHLPENELLYIGTQSVEVADDTPTPLHSQAIAKAKTAFTSPPNNALFGSSRYRTPIPLGLWAYNAFVDDTTGIRHWFFRTFATQPIYISTVNPALRTDVAENALRNYGYFDNSVAYSVDTLAGGRKARLSYTIKLGKPWYYGTVTYDGFTPNMDSLIRDTWADRLLRQGEQLSYTTLSDERNRLYTLFSNRGYYYFRPEMIALLADTTAIPHKAQLRVKLVDGLPAQTTKPWYIGETYFAFGNAHDTQTTTLHTDDASVTYTYPGKRIPIRHALLASRIAYRQGDLYSLIEQFNTQRNLNQLGVLSNVSINYVPRDTFATTDTLDVYISTLLAPTYELSIEANLTAKNNAQVGPGITASLSRKNLLRMAETIQLRMKGSYEWQTGRALYRKGNSINSFELGADLSMSVPQLLFPSKSHRTYRRPVSTSARVYSDWLQQGGFFRMLAFGGNLTYDLSTSATLTHSVSPLVLRFNTLEHTTQRFDSIMTANAAIGLSFRDQFTPSSSYTATYDNAVYRQHNPSKVTLSLTSAGAITSLIYAIRGYPPGEKEKSLLGTPYAQFLKGSIEACRYYHVAPHHTIATRFTAGLIYAYGNSSTAPFNEQFYVGGANDLRAFPLRGIGPGSYHNTERYAYIDHTGDIKLEANIEWRFPLAGPFSGALFVDAGNVWLLRNDENRPGAQLRWKSLGRDIALGTGIGLRYNLKVVLLRADVGIPLHIPYNTNKQGYYNVPRFAQSLCLHFGVGYPF